LPIGKTAYVVIGISMVAALSLGLFAIIQSSISPQTIAYAKALPEGKLFLSACPDASIHYSGASIIDPVAIVDLRYQYVPQLSPLSGMTLDLYIPVNERTNTAGVLNMTETRSIGEVNPHMESASITGAKVSLALQAAKSCEGIFSAIRMDHYNLTVGSHNYMVGYTFQNNYGKMINMTANYDTRSFEANFLTYNDTTLNLYFSNQTMKAIFGEPCANCGSKKYDLAVFVDDVDTNSKSSWFFMPDHTLSQINLEAGASRAGVYVTFMLGK
jgi:hypothetical protein